MKKQLFCLALLLLFVGCAKEVGDPNGEKPSVPEGIATSVTFNFSTESEFSTRTGVAPDPGILPEDTAPNVIPEIKTIHILIFDENSENLVTNTFINYSLQAKKTVTVSTTSGEKRIFTLINTPQYFSDIIKSYTLGFTSLTEFYTLMSNPLVRTTPLEPDPVSGSTTRTPGGDVLNGLGDVFISMVDQGGAGVFMSNGASMESLYTLQPDITQGDSNGSTLTNPPATLLPDGNVNRFDIVVMRGAARVKLTYASNLIQQLGNFKVIPTLDKKYMIRANGVGDIKYGLRNLNRSTYAVQHFLNDEVTDSDSGTNPGTHAIAAPRAPYYYHFTDYANILDKTNEVFDKYYWDSGFDINTPASDQTGPFYFIPENNNDAQVVGNTTYFGVEAIIQHVDGKDMSKSCNLVDQGVTNQQLKLRYYDIVPGKTETPGDHFHYDPTLTNAASNRLFVLRREPELRFNGYSRATKDPAVAFQVFYYVLEADGIIGTPNNNNTDINDGVWGAGTNTPPDKRFFAPIVNPTPTPTPTSGNTTPDPTQAQGYLYFANSTELQEVIMTMFNGTNENETRARALVAYFLEIKKYELHKILGIYNNATCYYRLNISEEVEHNIFNIVRRNFSYSAKITGFKSIGEPIPDGLDNPPDTPVNDELTFLTANIIVQPWREKVIEGIM